MDQKQMLLAFRIALGIAALAVLFPWAAATGTESHASIPGIVQGGSTSVSASVSGMSLVWGWLVLLAAIGGVVLSFMQPSQLLKENVKIGMAGIGGVIVILCIIAIATAGSVFGGNASQGNQFASASRTTGAAFGVYVALLGGVASAALGFFANWKGNGNA